ncbi:TPA: cation:dicarboxylate symporter family transporter, partial [Klebsiella pneumoniae]
MLTKGLIKNIGFQVVVAMVLGALVGALMGEQATVFAPLGTLFIQLIKMLVIPLVAVAILSGAANLGASPAAGKIGVTTLAFFLGTSALAVFLALVMGQVFKPGVGVDFGATAAMFSGDYADKGALP